MDEAWHEQVARREEWEREQAIAMADALMAIFGLTRVKEENHGKERIN